MMTIIMMACMYPVLLICVAVMQSYAKPHDGLFFGARLSEQRANEPRGQEITRSFRRRIWLSTAVLVAVSLLFSLVPYETVSVLLWVVWIFAMVVVISVPFIRANRAVRDWKREQGWSGSATQRLVELSDGGSVRCARWQSYLLPVALSLAAAAVSIALTGWQVAIALLSVALITPIYAVCALWMDGQRLKVISSDSAVNQNYNRARRRQWNGYWLLIAWLNTVYVGAVAVFVPINLDMAMNLLLWGSAVYLAALLIATVWLIQKGNALNRAYRPRMDVADQIDDDEQWLGGILYYNPADTRVNVEKRVGVGVTVNMATVPGKILSLVLALIIAGSLVLCGGLVWEEFAGLRWQESDGALVASQIFENYRIPVAEVQDVELVQELPALRRTNGTGMEHLCKGTFRDKDSGESCQLFLDPQNDLFVTFRLDGTTYYISGNDDTETRWLYNCLTEK